MTSPARSPGSTAPEQGGITSLHQRFGERWAITYGTDLSVWSAERRSASGLRLICDRDPAALAVKLAVAEAGQ
jgi:hypothetical protein